MVNRRRVFQAENKVKALSLMCSSDRKKATVTRAERIRCGNKGDAAADAGRV